VRQAQLCFGGKRESCGLAAMSPTAERLHAAKRDTARRLAAQLRGTSPPDWAESAAVQDAAAYTDPVRHAAELKALFRETPLVACLSSDLAAPGSFRRFDEAGVPIVVLRHRQGALRAFMNICPHRGARVVQDAQGNASRFTCHFHGWTYGADGQILGIPQKDGFAGCTQDRGLAPVPVTERHGLVFVQAAPASPEAFAGRVDGLLGSFAPEIAMLELERAEHVKSRVLPVAANWKYVLDTYGEGYHFATLHRDTIAPHFRADVQVYDRFGPNHRVSWAARPMTAWLEQQEQAWDVDSMIGWVHYIFPNTILFTGSTQPGRGYVTLFRHFPGALPGETKTCKSIYAPAGIHSDEQRAEIEAAFDATAHVVVAEDYMVAAEGWANLASLPAGATVVYGRQEVALQNVHAAIASAIGVAAPRRAETVPAETFSGGEAEAA
jgi:phenylpropionate dioxygenase-like ring-hydroxylating dioxygenase large terminal subunit